MISVGADRQAGARGRGAVAIRTGTSTTSRTRIVVAAFAALIVLGLTPGVARAVDRPIGPLSPSSGAWFGASVNYNTTDGVAGGQGEITARETFLGRQYDIINRFYGFNVAIPTSLESWSASVGHIPMITWGAPADTIQLRNGVHDTWLRAQADRLAAFGSPIFLRFYHEMDGAYRQSTVHSAQDFIAAWRHVHDIFEQRGATNVVWVWCPTSWNFVTGNPWPPNYYPGNDYVDWIAADGYSWFPRPGAPWRSWQVIFQDFYDWASTMGKPIMIAENGVMEDPNTPGRKAGWITESATLMKTVYPLIQAVLYFDLIHVTPQYTYTWPVDTSTSSYQAYRAMGADPYFDPSQGPPDTTPPTQPGTPSGVSNSPTSIDLTWSASTDDVSSTLTYLVRRDGQQVGTVDSSSTTSVGFTDSGLASGSTHTYSIVALDGAGNPSPESGISAPITVQSAGPSIFADDFSSGGFTNWNGVTRLTIAATSGGDAPPSARAQVTNQSAWAYRTLPGTFGSVCMSLAVNAASTGGSAPVLLRLRTGANGPVARVFVNTSGTLVVRSDVSGAQRFSGVALGTGWHTIELCGTVGSAGQWSLYRDGVQIVAGWTANTGTTPVGRIEIGDTAAKTFTINFDDVIVDQEVG
jgi:hypothetical protein